MTDTLDSFSASAPSGCFWIFTPPAPRTGFISDVSYFEVHGKFWSFQDWHLAQASHGLPLILWCLGGLGVFMGLDR